MTKRENYSFSGSIERAVTEVDALLAAGPGELNLDFSAVTFISVDGLEWLEELLLRAESQKVRVSFQNLRPEQYKVFKVAHINSLLAACGALSLTGPAC